MGALSYWKSSPHHLLPPLNPQNEWQHYLSMLPAVKSLLQKPARAKLLKWTKSLTKLVCLLHKCLCLITGEQAGIVLRHAYQSKGCSSGWGWENDVGIWNVGAHRKGSREKSRLSQLLIFQQSWRSRAGLGLVRDSESDCWYQESTQKVVPEKDGHLEKWHSVWNAPLEACWPGSWGGHIRITCPCGSSLYSPLSCLGLLCIHLCTLRSGGRLCGWLEATWWERMTLPSFVFFRGTVGNCRVRKNTAENLHRWTLLIHLR